ncbi:MAG TPA: LuxR family transcriptional regulator [Solirubrobacterales bacterium]|jgi:DNA-binding CsgD family transcriptional regulator|nr:LuxR family transcriptional regulator [Solirubrobacterales bacterium]
MPAATEIGFGTEPADSDTSPRLIGRAAQTERLDGIIDRLRDRGAALVVSGEAGIGKSALLDHARRRAEAAGYRTLSVAGVESEAELGFAGLHQMLGPTAGLADRLPGPQRRALQAAFGIVEDVAPDRFHVALAAHRVVCELARPAPLLLIVDDAQWLDRSSLEVLAFIARRLENEPVALLAAVRDGYRTALEEERLPGLRLERLGADQAAELLDRVAPEAHPILRARILAEAAGNPLGLVELGRSLPGGMAAGQRLEPLPTTLTARLERAFAARLDGLPQPTRLVLLAGALDGRASLQELLRCAGMLQGTPVTLSAVDAAIAACLVEVVGTQLHFRHPLMRSAVGQATPSAQLLEMYGALAEVVADPERRLWHRAMATVEPDEDMAAALEAQAADARRRGAVSAAAAALERAAALSPDPRAKGDRLVKAAEIAYELGVAEAVGRLIGEAEPLELGSLEASRLAWLRQMVSGDVWVEAGATKVFVSIAEQMSAGGDVDMALRSLVPIAHRCWWTKTRTRTRQYLVDAAKDLGVPADDPRLLAVIGLAHPEATGTEVRRRVAGRRPHDSADPMVALQLGIAAEKTGDFSLAAPFLDRAVVGLREQGRLGALTQALTHYAWAATHTGDWQAARATGVEAAELACDTGQPQYGQAGQMVGAIVAAFGGDEADVEAMLATVEPALLASGAGPMLAPACIARGALALGEGRHDDAFRRLWPIFDEAAPTFHRFDRWSAVLDLVEGGVHGEHVEQVPAVIDELDRVARRSGAPVLVAGLACAKPLVADEDEREALYLAALAEDLADNPFLRARTQFSFGRWLRRQRRNADARGPLRMASESFGALGAAAWGMRAREELRATGERLGPRRVDARDRLTSQELRIARLAAQGLSNREIGERLLLSHRTIGSHLYRIFPKLEVTARGQLRDALAAADLEQEAVV